MTDKSGQHQAAAPWSFPVVVAELPEDGGHYEIAADEAARERIAALAGLKSLTALSATFDLARRGDGVHLEGQVKARVGQSCVVTLELVEGDVDEAVNLDYAPDLSDDKAKSERRGKKKKGDPPDALENGCVDLGVVATEFLILGLDPYPRAPGARFTQSVDEEPSAKPFAALEALKKRPE